MPVRFVAVGLTAAALGMVLLLALIHAGWPPWLANAATVLVTLQLNFLGNRYLTWRGRLAGSPRSTWTRWWRFHAARGASTVLSIALFPVLAPRLGASVAYWTLLAAGAVLNYCTDRWWSFDHRDTRPGARLACLLGVSAAGVLAAVLFLDAFIVVVSLFMLVVTVTTLAFQLYKWWRPEHGNPARYGSPDTPRLPGVILVPMRHEEAVAGTTLDRLATLSHPNYRVMPIVDYADDQGTARIVRAKAREYPGRILECPYPSDHPVHNKPIGLNAAIERLDRLGVRFEWVGIADAEDLFHPDLLHVVDYRFRRTNAAVVQCGVQLMNFNADPDAVPQPGGPPPPLRRWWRANTSAWWRAANVLEYFKWFQSRLKLQAAMGIMPLGGNTVFFRRRFIDTLRARYGRAWDEECLTEDCKIGILASVLGYRVDVVYLEELVTREETPSTLRGLLRQRVRWMQGFIQVFRSGEWLALPTRAQRLLAVYVLGFQFFQAFAAALAPVALAMAIWHKSPIVVTLLASLPLGLGLLNVALDVVLLRQFSRTFGIRARLRDYLGLIVGAYPFQLVLSLAAIWAILRYTLGRNNWVKTAHQGAHLPGAPQPELVGSR
ncbi:MAG TPA: glycosyltransferase [Actinophytocola sp.]|uniref:glycosyltransferase n=1 Tax=Actinophytocola sp. TaxID=1872138 RepID=UPI002DDD97CA|nr:glycosyltransferase [Actinophytocola sp.]HEV2778871.1 glycosyltransferase [Actinophytocola sp.]